MITAILHKVKTFKYLGSLLTYQNSNQEEIKCRHRAGNWCYYSFQTLFSSRLLSKNLKIKIYKTIILPVVLYGCETWEWGEWGVEKTPQWGTS